jgi:hypothetical protein
MTVLLQVTLRRLSESLTGMFHNLNENWNHKFPTHCGLWRGDPLAAHRGTYRRASCTGRNGALGLDLPYRFREINAYSVRTRRNEKAELDRANRMGRGRERT